MDDHSKQRVSAVRAALYARVSSEQQAQQSTIESQIVALKGWDRSTPGIFREKWLSGEMASVSSVF
jgi:predicted site-specific integrase-resolvase